MHQSPSRSYCIATDHRARVVCPQVHLFDAVPNGSTARLVDRYFKGERLWKDRPLLTSHRRPEVAHSLSLLQYACAGKALRCWQMFLAFCKCYPRASRQPTLLSVFTRARDTSVSKAATETVHTAPDRVVDTDCNARHIADLQGVCFAVDLTKLRAVEPMPCHCSAHSGSCTAPFVSSRR